MMTATIIMTTKSIQRPSLRGLWTGPIDGRGSSGSFGGVDAVVIRSSR